MNDIYLIRGDSKKIRFKRTDCQGNVIKEKADKMYFSVKYSDDDTAPLLFQKTLDNGITYDEESNYYFIEIQPKDTNGLPYVNLFYDVEIKVGDYTKTIAKGQIKLDGEITHAKDEEMVGNGKEYYEKVTLEATWKE